MENNNINSSNESSNDDSIQISNFYNENEELIEAPEENNAIEEVESPVTEAEETESTFTNDSTVAIVEDSPRESLKDDDIIFYEDLNENILLEEPLEKHESVDKEELVKNKNSYFEDDELFLGDDEVLVNEKDMAVFQQLEGVVTWEIENLYDSEGKTVNKRDLKSNPPILKVKGSDGDYAEFIITKEFAKSLSEKFDEIYRAYFGVKPKGKRSETGAPLDEAKAFVKEHSVAVAVSVSLVILFLIYTMVIH